VSKILKNNTALVVSIDDTGKTVPASGQLTIDPNWYLLFAASGDTITLVGDSTLTVNDGSADLSISDGIDLIKGIFPKKIAVGNELLTQFIAFVGDRLKVDSDLSAYTDALSHALAIIDFPHHETHEGDAHVFTDNTDLDDGENLHVAITAPNTAKQAHFVFWVRAEDEAFVRFYEAPTTLVKGAVKPSFNRNRFINSAATVVLNEVTSFVSKGTLIYSEHFAKSEHERGSSRGTQEFILNKNTEYIFEINSEKQGNEVSWGFDWYEHTDPTQV